MQLASVAVLTATLAAAAPADADTDPRPPRSENVALGLSLGGSLMSVGLMAAALSDLPNDDSDAATLWATGILTLAITPSLGHLYAGDVWTPGLGVRAAGAALAAVGAVQSVDCLFESCGFVDGGGAALVAGAGLVAIGAVWDIATARDAARRYNEKRISLVPSAPGANIGLSLVGRF